MDKEKKWLRCLSREQIKKWAGAFEKESGRGAVLISISLIDHLCTVRLTQEFSKGNNTARSRLLNGGLQAFAVKLDLLFCIGLIPSDIHNDIRSLNRLRKDCAHDWEHFEVTNEIIEKYIKPMFMYTNASKQNGPFFRQLQEAEGNRPSEIFRLVMLSLISVVNLCLANIKRGPDGKYDIRETESS
jgi:DNA-binding MltR family transcriptional regulator